MSALGHSLPYVASSGSVKMPIAQMRKPKLEAVTLLAQGPYLPRVSSLQFDPSMFASGPLPVPPRPSSAGSEAGVVEASLCVFQSCNQMLLSADRWYRKLERHTVVNNHCRRRETRS